MLFLTLNSACIINILCILKKKKKKLTRLRIYVKDKTSGLLCYNIQPDLTSFILL